MGQEAFNVSRIGSSRVGSGRVESGRLKKTIYIYIYLVSSFDRGRVKGDPTQPDPRGSDPIRFTAPEIVTYRGICFFVQETTKYSVFLTREGSTLSAPYSAGERFPPLFHFVSKPSRNLRGTLRRVLDQFSSSLGYRRMTAPPRRVELERRTWSFGEEAPVPSSLSNSSGMTLSANRRNASL